MTSPAPAYAIRSLLHSYNGDVALKIPSLDIEKGQTCVFSGPNGGGKSTLLSILALLLAPTSGSVLLNGVESAGKQDTALRRKVTLVHQKPILFSASVRHNIEYGLRARGVSSKDISQRTDKIIERAGLQALSGKHARSLSGGEAQRVALARALVLETPILLLDEPTNSLDDASRVLLYGMLRDAAERGATIVIASHDPDVVESLNPRIYRLEKGRLV